MTPPRRSTRIKKEITTTYPMVVLNPTTVLKKRKASRSFSTFTTNNSESDSESSDLEKATEQEVKDNNSDDDNDDFQPVIKFTTRRKQRISATPAKKIKMENDIINFSTFSSSTSTPALSTETSSIASSSTVTTPPDHDDLDLDTTTAINNGKSQKRNVGTKRSTKKTVPKRETRSSAVATSTPESYPMVKKEKDQEENKEPINKGKNKISNSATASSIDTKTKDVLVNDDDSDESNGANSDETNNDSSGDDDDDYSADDSDSELENDEPIRNNNTNTTQVSSTTGDRAGWNKRVSQKLSERHNELATVWDDLKAIENSAIVPIEQPENLLLSLLPFQRYGVAWMIQQERSEKFNGGILADEMGMGKTIQTISLLLHDNCKKNLVIAPAVAILQWKKEIESHTKNNMKVHIFHGPKRATSVEELESFDVVITTYSVMETAFRRQEYGSKQSGLLVKEKSLLHKINWHRIILDEAHNIKDRSCNTARSVFNLNGKYKWSLTGTPLQNRVGELYSLIRFMQADPFGYYFCKQCDCKSISWAFANKKTCDHCNHTPMDHVCWWNNELLKPIQKFGNSGDGREAMEKLVLLLDKIMLRRTKLECADDLGLPPRTVIVRRDLFNEEEEDVYHSLYSDTARKFNNYVEEGSVLNNYANIFELLTKMRQSCNHPDLVTKKKDVSDNKQLVCNLCNEPPEDAISAGCKHTFCRECCIQYVQSFDGLSNGEKPKCPICFADFSVDLSQPSLVLDYGQGTHAAFSKSSIVNRINMNQWRSSTKIEALVEELSRLRANDRSIKSIVFSQFVNFLDLVYWRLSKAGFQCIRLDGTMTPQQRDAAIKHFMTKPSVTVFLISLKAGGVALNLTEASRVFICDPWWNPAAELQAMDRIHRLGQHRPIRITRLIIENSIESRIVQLQEKKTALVSSTIDKDLSAMDRLSVDDFKFLFLM